ncbi:hypothetical protein [Flavobacterium pedocola]
MAFSKTINYYNAYKSSKELSEKSADFHTEILNLKAKETQLDSLLSENNLIKDELFQNELLKIINSNTVANKLTLIDFKEPHLFIKEHKKIQSYLITLKGQYQGFAKLINEIEKNKSLGLLIHTKYYKIKNLKNNSDDLFVDVIIQKSE